CLLLYTEVNHLHLHSFPTRRSSDLEGEIRRVREEGRRALHQNLKSGTDHVFRGRQRELFLRVSGCRIAQWPSRLSLVHTTPKKRDRKSTRLNSSHLGISYAVFCLKK